MQNKEAVFQQRPLKAERKQKNNQDLAYRPVQKLKSANILTFHIPLLLFIVFIYILLLLVTGLITPDELLNPPFFVSFDY